MKISRIKIENFRGIKNAELLLTGHTVFVGDNNSGKSTVLEAIDLVIGPERMNRKPIIDEHDFFAGKYITKTAEESTNIIVELVITDLNDEQLRHFVNHIEWWDTKTSTIIDGPPPTATDQKGVTPALRVFFKGNYDYDEDDFIGQTFYSSPQKDDNTFDTFRTSDKRVCGFLYLRTLRTGTRALSLEHGSLLDIILRLKELRPQMWEKVISQLQGVSVANEPEVGIVDILISVQKAIQSFLPIDCANNPSIRVSSLTREHLRKVLIVFLGSGVNQSDGTEYFTPYYHQGTGTINTMVLALLTIIAKLKQNVIFAMEEPEIALPPHTQKRIITSVIAQSAQAIFTSHSPYVLEEFNPKDVLVISRVNGVLNGISADSPPNITKKKYKEELRKRFCESLLARRVLITEGRTEYDAYLSASRRLNSLLPEKYMSFDNLGISVINAETDSQVGPLGDYYKRLDKLVFAIFDQQDEDARALIESAVDYPFEAPEKGIEKVVLNFSDAAALRRYALQLVSDNEWPTHLSMQIPTADMNDDKIKDSLMAYFKWSKGSGGIADFLEQCSESEMPGFIRNTILSIKETVDTILNQNNQAETFTDAESVE